MGIKGILGGIGKISFPFIAAAATGGSAPLIGMAAQAVGKALGLDKVEATQDGIEKVISADPDALLKLKQADQEFQLAMEKLGFDSIEKLAEIDADDRASARAREIAVKDSTPRVLAFLVTIGFFGLLAWLAVKPVPDMSKDIIIAMVGVLGTAWIGIVNYFFGSSSGSSSKSATIDKLLSK